MSLSCCPCRSGNSHWYFSLLFRQVLSFVSALFVPLLSPNRPEVLSLIQRLPSCPKTAFFVGCWYCGRAGSLVDVLLLLLTSNLVYFCFGPSGACVYHGLLFEVGELEYVLGKALRGCCLNLTPAAAFSHPCDWGAGHRSVSFQSAGKCLSLLWEVGNSPWAFGPCQSN